MSTKTKRLTKEIPIGDGKILSLKVPLSIGTLQWGTTSIDHNVINPKGCISESATKEILTELCLGKITLYDTAEGYGGGTSEKRLGRHAFSIYNHQNRNSSTNDNHIEPIFMTKFLPAPWRGIISYSSFESALRASLRRMQVKCCPIYLIHSPIHWRSLEYWIYCAAQCKQKGLLQTVGLSNCNADQVRRAVHAGRKYGVDVVINQVMFNLLDYNSTSLQEMKETCDELNVTVIAYSPFGQGLLTDALTQENFKSVRPAKMFGLSWDSLVPLRNCMERIATSANSNGDDSSNKNERSMAQVAINWCIAHDTIPLVGCRTLRQAKDSLGALDWSLTKEEVKELDRLALSRSTLDSPPFRRVLFVTLASFVMMACQMLDLFGFGMVLEASK